MEDEEHDLDYKIEIREETDSSLYEWYIAQIDDADNEVGFLTDKAIPFHFNNYFRIKNLSYQNTLRLNRRELGINKPSLLKESPEIDETKMITGSFIPYQRDNNEPKYSMFGTEREIEEFKIFIQISNEAYCRLDGSPAYENQIDFENYHSPDIVEIFLGVPDERFNEIVTGIENKSITAAYLELSEVKGFYSNWSPSISVPHIKVLTQWHKLKIPKNLEIETDCLGDVGDFYFLTQTSNDLFEPLKNEDEDDGN